jgi:hypothetical protein
MVFEKKKVLLVSTRVLLIVLSAALLLFANKLKKNKELILEDFSDELQENGGLPHGWYASRKDRSMFTIYEENGERFARIDVTKGCTSFGRQVDYSATDLPLLSWRWRVHKLPENGFENRKDKNDSGAAVYVIFKGKLKLNRIIKYVWSANLPEGATMDSPFNSRTKIVVLKNGNTHIGQWLCETVNIEQDFRRLFNDVPPTVAAIAILSDADNTGSQAVADYDHFVALSE